MFGLNKNLRKKVTRTAATHRDSLRKNLEHRLELARANGNETLVRKLEAEANYLRLD
ncbi:MAG: hypothetical protein F6J86_14840 [Symploca sp. SIO1B1]|nr:hypothetical protein [Symploca sp. SIO1C2]NER95089.1 hypothetical protein [Symploca sp. SIO1B1]